MQDSLSGDGNREWVNRASIWHFCGLIQDLHGFRHTYMTCAQRAQIPVKTLQAIGGYADLATLQDRYVHTQHEDIEAARAAIEDMFLPAYSEET